MRFTWLLCGILAVAPRAAAQAPEPSPPPREPTALLPATAPGRPESAAEPGELAEQARATVARVRPHAGETVRVEVDENGALSLSGEVALLGDKLSINDALVELPGADIIINRLVTAPLRRSDAAIARDVRRRLANDPALRDLPIEVRVENQEVFLRGRAPSGIDVATAVRVAADVRGVRDVHTERLEAALPAW